MLPAVLFIFLLALVAPWIYRLAGRATGWLLAAGPFGLAIFFASLISRVAGGETISTSIAWLPEVGVNLTLYLDGLSLLFALLITGIGAMVLIYAGAYLGDHRQIGRFYAFLLLFMASMLGLVLAGNLLALFIFWELTSISSFLLIGFEHERAESRTAARQALLVTGGGGLALLAGLILLGMAGGSFELPELLNRPAGLPSSPLYLPIVLLVLLGAFTKSAQVPFHFWLPNAMEAPTPVSAYLHSATMVKAGVYLLARLHPLLGGTDLWFTIITPVGAITMLTGGILAFYQTDLKRMLAYSTISALGTLVLLLGIGSAIAIKAAMVFLLAHALYKGALFMVAGILDHETGTRDAERLGGLRHAMPITALAAGLAAVSLAGLPPVFNFIAKELLFEAALETPGSAGWLVPVVVLTGALFVVSAAIAGIRPFFGQLRETPRTAHEAPIGMWLGPLTLAALGLLFGLIPGLVANPLIAPATHAITGQNTPVSLYLWHGLNIPLALSGLSIAAGIGLYAGWNGLRRNTAWVIPLFAWGPNAWYQQILSGIDWIARTQTRFFQSGLLRRYLFITLLATVTLAGWTLISRDGLPTSLEWQDAHAYEIALAVLMLLAAGVAVRSPGRLSTVAALGVVGFGVALIYILYGAPDLAMTQILVETLTVILFVLVFYHLPPFARVSSLAVRIRDATIALATGGLITLLVLAATATPPDSMLSPYFAENSKTLGHGNNIVNVILVDFRGFDTLGEITVLSVAAIGVFALIKARAKE